eukprot:TRINITY_DN44762_c0_g1_i1.p1 TRINITY_DN44762_c0_g1~~TRINITY_DN44762_c0_g1_i1.p1  ORF type:complete len:437 (+),score=116.77 TRINITY_DN44762_c0_g1_i1:84-1313(+)
MLRSLVGSEMCIRDRVPEGMEGNMVGLDYKLLGDHDPDSPLLGAVTSDEALVIMPIPQKIAALRVRAVQSAVMVSGLPAPQLETDTRRDSPPMRVTKQGFEKKWVWLQRRQQLMGSSGRQLVQFTLPHGHTVRGAVKMMLNPVNKKAWVQNHLIFVKKGAPGHSTIEEARAFTRGVFSAMLSHLVATEAGLFVPSDMHPQCFVLPPRQTRLLAPKAEALYSLVGQLLGKLVLDKHAVAVHFSREVYSGLLIGRLCPPGFKQSLAAMATGFDSVIPPEISQVFDSQELELLTCGLTNTSTTQLYRATAYSGLYANLGSSHETIRWLWDIVHGFDLEARSRLLQFLFGCTVPPLMEEGREDEPLITIVDGDGDQPVMNTVDRVLKLPLYPDQAHLAYRLRLAIELDVDVDM